MKTANMTRNKGQVYSVGNYLLTGKVLGKGHFARVEEATHRIIGKKVAIKIIDLTCIKEEYARRNLHREPRVMAKLRHPCIAALYETMMHGPRLYVVMEAAGGGDLCAHVLGARSAARGLPEGRARALAAQLVSAVRHMHARGVVHRDLKMENIMLDSTKQFIKIVDFGLSNMWSGGAALRTPCGSLEYAAPELFVDGRRYGPEVDLWSIGVIVYGMVTGGLPFTGADTGADKSQPQLRAAISRGFTRKQRAALACVTPECKAFIQHLLEPNVELRMKIEEASRHRWVRRPGMRMKTHPFGTIDPVANREIYRQISELCAMPVIDVVAEIKSEPFGPLGGMYNIKCHLQQQGAAAGPDLLWGAATPEPRPLSPPEYRAHTAHPHPHPHPDPDRATTSRASTPAHHLPTTASPPKIQVVTQKIRIPSTPPPRPVDSKYVSRSVETQIKSIPKPVPERASKKIQLQSPRVMSRPLCSLYGVKKAGYAGYDNGDCGLDPRLPSIDEHSNSDVNEAKKVSRSKNVRMPCVRKSLCSRYLVYECPARYSWRAGGTLGTPPPRIILQSNTTTIKRASLGNIVSPHSSSNSQCKSERAMPVGWYSTRSIGKDAAHLQRLRRTAPMK
ncbi:hypothetical protein HF086_014728 [Spodoptera exigua]|uniref:Protein kinase domain-containing protein n=1 Tax=Spodoptera exigua TaxID=7107 RepID=A0A922SBK9_SPOEX|nr:hypothetical protein HF086_014728 [Spodoptera exigua]